MQPPNPAPVSRAPTTPGHAAGDVDQRVEGRRADLEVVAQRSVAGSERDADRRQVTGLERRDRVVDPLRPR